jgi:hypothetical protein
MSQNEQESVGKRWYVAPWPPLAWLETGIKLVAIVVGIVALIQTLSAGVFVLPSGLRLAQWVVLILLSLGLLAAIMDRVLMREIVSMAFVILNNLGHWGMVVALAGEPGPGVLLPLFAGLMLAGDVVKLVFLRVHDFEVRDTPRAVLFGLTSVYVVGYLVLLLLQLMQ